MSFRSRLLLALAAAALVPLAGFAVALRVRVTERLTDEYDRRVASLAEGIEQELAQRDAFIRVRLSSLTSALAEDNRFRLALRGAPSERSYLLNYAEHAARLTGLTMLQIQDEAGRILSSGHFRNEFDRLEPELLRALRTAPPGLVLASARSPDGPFFALVQFDSVRTGGRRFILVGGQAIDDRDLQRMAGGSDIVVSLITPDTVLSSGTVAANSRPLTSSSPGSSLQSGDEPDSLSGASVVLREFSIAAVRAVRGDSAAVVPVRLIISHPRTTLAALRRSIDAGFLVAAVAAAAAALILAAWLAARVSRPLAELATKTSRVDLDRLDVDFRSDRNDEIGDLSRLLGVMTARLRSGARKLREVERRATLGEIARQVNHDVKNGLIPLRNVLRHLAQVQRDNPDRLVSVFAERHGTLESSIAYLETLAQNYARLSPRLDLRRCDIHAVIEEVVRNAREFSTATVQSRANGPLPPVRGDPLVLRRILENLVGNAIDSLESRPGTVLVSAESLTGNAGQPMVRVTVQDTGSGMTEEVLARAFDDFYTTKRGGTGLGLSVVRRLVLDLNGSLRVSTKPGEGTRVTIEVPVDARESGRGTRDSGFGTRDSGAAGPSPESRIPRPE